MQYSTEQYSAERNSTVRYLLFEIVGAVDVFQQLFVGLPPCQQVQHTQTWEGEGRGGEERGRRKEREEGKEEVEGL
jgi:hypothetical protein